MSAEIGIDLLKAKNLLDDGNVIGIPTETVYGLAANATNAKAVTEIFKIKNRPFFNPLIVHVANLESVKKYVKTIPSIAYQLFESFSPGPLTLLLEKNDLLPDLVTAGSNRVAIRIPNHPLALELLQLLDYPLAAPSANPFGYVSPTMADHVNAQLGENILYILDGGSCQVGVESTIVGFENGENVLYRLGGVSLEQIEEKVGKIVQKTAVEHIPDAPGMLKSHYSPKKSFYVGNINELLENLTGKKVGVISFQKPYALAVVNYILSEKGDLSEAAAHLFSSLRQMDNADVEVILAEWLPEIGLGRAINDRLNRARLKFD